MSKEQLIYNAASEAVTRARLIMSNLLTGDDLRRVDDVLYHAQRNAGDWAVLAHKADARKIKNVNQLLRS